MTAKFHMADGNIIEVPDNIAHLKGRVYFMQYSGVSVEASPEILEAIRKNIDVPLVVWEEPVKVAPKPEPVDTGSRLPKR